MTITVDTTTGEVRPNPAAEASSIVQGWIDQMFAPLVMTEAEMFAGLAPQHVTDLRALLERRPSLRLTLCRAAQYRQGRREQVRRPVSERFVYFILAANSGLIKIGSAVDPASRLRVLQTGSPEPLRLIRTIPGGAELERQLHRDFAADRVHGEWFRPSEVLLDLVEGVR